MHQVVANARSAGCRHTRSCGRPGGQKYSILVRHGVKSVRSWFLFKNIQQEQERRGVLDRICGVENSDTKLIQGVPPLQQWLHCQADEYWAKFTEI